VKLAIWKHLLRPLMPWIGRLVVAILAGVAIAWVAGSFVIRRAEPEHVETLPAGVPGRMVVVGGRPMHVVEQGDGEPVILVHGFAGSTADWEDDVLPALAARHHVVAVDLLGMGFSARGDDLAYGYDLWSRQIVELMDALGIARAALVAHSLGGAVAAITAGEHPDRVTKLALVAPLVPLEQSERPWYFKLLEIPGVGEAMLASKDHLPDLPGFSAAYVARAREIYRRAGTRQALLTYLRHGRDTGRLITAYREIHAPTLVVHGTNDDVVPYTAVRRAVPDIADVLVLPIDTAGHWLMRDHPRKVIAALNDFL
jgi:pimeloyl-ACP methyl ester carboxylesterase